MSKLTKGKILKRNHHIPYNEPHGTYLAHLGNDQDDTLKCLRYLTPPTTCENIVAQWLVISVLLVCKTKGDMGYSNGLELTRRFYMPEKPELSIPDNISIENQQLPKL